MLIIVKISAGIAWMLLIVIPRQWGSRRHITRPSISREGYHGLRSTRRGEKREKTRDSFKQAAVEFNSLTCGWELKGPPSSIFDVHSSALLGHRPHFEAETKVSSSHISSAAGFQQQYRVHSSQ